MFNIKSELIRIRVGTKCNLNCEYCGQRHEGEHSVASEQEINKLIDYLNKLPLPEGRDYFDISFTGGETLLYLDTVKFIYNKLKNNPNFQFSLITNGVLLTNDIIDYLNDNNICLTVSYDGTGSQCRHYDVLTSKKDLLLKAKNLSFSVVLSNKAYIYDAFNELQQFDIEYFAKHKYHVHNINCLEFCNITNKDELLNFDYDYMQEQYAKMFKILFEHLTNHNIKFFHDNYLIINFIQKLIRYLSADCSDLDNVYTFCSELMYGTNVSLQGNVVLCPVKSDIVLGNVFDNTNTLENNINMSCQRLRDRLKTMCKNCIALKYCRGNCRIIADNEMSKICDSRIKISNIIYNEIINMNNNLSKIDLTYQKINDNIVINNNIMNIYTSNDYNIQQAFKDIFAYNQEYNIINIDKCILNCALNSNAYKELALLYTLYYNKLISVPIINKILNTLYVDNAIKYYIGQSNSRINFNEIFNIKLIPECTLNNISVKKDDFDHTILSIDDLCLTGETDITHYLLPLKNASGDVFLCGLGLGILPQLLKYNNKITSITILESNKDIISLANTYLKDELQNVKIINGDLYTYDFINQHYDYAYIDVWHQFSENKIEEQHLLYTRLSPYIDKIDFLQNVIDSYFNDYLYDQILEVIPK